MHWIPIKDLDKYKAFLIFIKEYLQDTLNKIIHIVTDEREGERGARRLYKCLKRLW